MQPAAFEQPKVEGRVHPHEPIFVVADRRWPIEFGRLPGKAFCADVAIQREIGNAPGVVGIDRIDEDVGQNVPGAQLVGALGEGLFDGRAPEEGSADIQHAVFCKKLDTRVVIAEVNGPGVADGHGFAVLLDGEPLRDAQWFGGRHGDIWPSLRAGCNSRASLATLLPNSDEVSVMLGAQRERISLSYEGRGGKVAVLKFNHTEVLNAVGGQMLEEFTDAVAELRANADARALLITGEGRAFCAGANLQDDGKNTEGKRSGDGLRSGYHPLLLALRDLPMGIVTAVNGAAAGVGMSFAIVGDIVCASKSAYFLQAFARIGLVPDGGSTFMLPRMIGWGRAMELSMLAERLPAEQAHEWGLVNRLFEDNDALMTGAMEVAERFANGPKSIHLIRKAYWNTWHNAYEQQLDLEAQLQNEAGQSNDFKEGVQAFLEKRDAEFTGS